MFDHVPCHATFKELIDYCNKEICKAFFVLDPVPWDAKRSALRGGPCVALTQPLPRALVKYELPTRSFNWRELLKTLCKYWLIRQAHEQYFQTYFGRPR